MTLRSLFVLAWLAAGLVGQNPAALKPPKAALLFKSGQAHLYRELPVSLSETRTRFRLPSGIHGTVWLGSDQFRLVSATASFAPTTVKKPVESLIDVLRMAEGRRVRLHIQRGRETVVQPVGRIVKLLGAIPEVAAGAEPRSSDPSAVVFSTDDQKAAIYPISAIAGVSEIEAKDGADSWTYDASFKTPVLDVLYDPSESPGETTGTLGLANMADGMAWAPSYVLDLGKDNKARLVGKAVVMNDIEDLVDTQVRLVIGYPNLRFASVTSSLLPEVRMNAFRAMLQGTSSDPQGILSNPMSQVLSNIAIASNDFSGSQQISGPTTPTAGEESEDLYLYDIGKITLTKGARSYVPLLEETIGYRHRYDWDIADQVDNYARFVNRNNANQPSEIWHVLLLENKTSAPWTTAPVLIQSEKGPLAQSMLTYTPPGSENSIKLTKALGLVGTTLEYRADDALADRQELRLFGNRYEQIEVKGRIELRNQSQKSCPVRVNKQLSGDIISTTAVPEVKGRAKGLGQVNASRTITWEFELEPGATWAAEYRYQVLIRR